MAISHLKHSYLNWRANPCRRKDYSFSFFNFVFWIWLSWFSFGLNRIFQVHDMTINFSFVLFHSFFSLFFNGPLWAISHVVDGLLAWSISSHMRIILKGLAFDSRLLVSFLSREKYGSKIFPRNEQFLVNVPGGINQGDFRASWSWDLWFWSLKRFDKFEAVASLDAYQITNY